MRQGALIGPVIVAIGVVVAAIAFAIVTTLLDTADSGADLRLGRAEQALQSLEEARSEDAARIDALQQETARLREDLSLVANRAPVGAAPLVPVDTAAVPQDENFEAPPDTEALTEIMRLARARFNQGITQPRNRTMMQILGPPRDSYSDDCQPVSNPALRRNIETRQVGPIRVTMLVPALESLGRVMDRLRDSDPDIYAKVGTAGALCARFVRGSRTAVSNHSWGTAIDLTLEGQLDGFGDGGTQFGLLILAEYFNDEGWFWGATFSREDSMHFEIGEEALRAWKAEGRF